MKAMLHAVLFAVKSTYTLVSGLIRNAKTTEFSILSQASSTMFAFS